VKIIKLLAIVLILVACQPQATPPPATGTGELRINEAPFLFSRASFVSKSGLACMLADASGDPLGCPASYYIQNNDRFIVTDGQGNTVVLKGPLTIESSLAAVDSDTPVYARDLAGFYYRFGGGVTMVDSRPFTSTTEVGQK
jgi:hypothetical protein